MSFEDDLKAFAEKTNQRIDQVVRHAVDLVAQGVVTRSPVGNPQLWKANANYYAMRDLDEDSRKVYNLFIDAANAARAEGEKKMRRLGKKRLESGLKYQHSSYVGGRFRSNWMFGVGAPDTTTTENIDPDRAMTIARIQAGVADQKAGGIFYITNSLVYSLPLEYGWSGQAPAGMVRTTLAELPARIEAYVRAMP